MAKTSSPARKCYEQICPVARALDVVGDRWTLLMIRELLGGPARFQELQQGLPGIAKNLLTDRLRRLEEDGVVRHVKTSHGAHYTLTEHGAALRTAVEALGLWGAKARKISPPKHGRSVRATAMALQTFLTMAEHAQPEERTVVELEIEGEPLEIVLGPDPSVSARPSTEARARVRTSKESMADYLAGRAFDKRAFPLVSGDKSVRTALLQTMGAMV